MTSEVQDCAPQLWLRGPVLTQVAAAPRYPTRDRQSQGARCDRLRLLPIALFALMMSINPARSDALSECVQAEITSKTIDSCTQVIEAGQADKNDLAWAHFNRGTAFGIKGQLDSAIADLDKAIELNPQWAAAYSNRALGYMRKGQPERAIEDYSRAIELKPKDSMRYIDRGGALMRLKQLDRAIGDFSK